MVDFPLVCPMSLDILTAVFEGPGMTGRDHHSEVKMQEVEVEALFGAHGSSSLYFPRQVISPDGHGQSKESIM